MGIIRKYQSGSSFQPRVENRSDFKYTNPVKKVSLTPEQINTGAAAYSDPNTIAKQTELKKMGFYDGNIDGIWGPKSIAAWSAYNEGQAITPTPVQQTKSFTKSKVRRPLGLQDLQKYTSGSTDRYGYYNAGRGQGRQELTQEQYNMMLNKNKF